MKKNVKNIGFFIFFIAVKKKTSFFGFKISEKLMSDTNNNWSDYVILSTK